MYLTGYDLSSYQGNLSQGVFQALKNDGYFAIIRVNEGTPNNSQVLNIDSKFIVNRQEARNVSLFRLFNHFSYPIYNSAQSEASFFTTTFGTPQNGEGFTLDFERPFTDSNGNPTGENVTWALDWLNQVTQTYNGTKPFIYMDLSLCNALDWSPVVDADYALWLADWTGNPNELGTAKNWHFIAMSQFTDKGTLPTGETPVDQDAFYGTPQDFEDYTFHAPVSTVSTPSQTISTPTHSTVDTGTTNTSNTSTTVSTPQATVSTTPTPSPQKIEVTPTSSIQRSGTTTSGTATSGATTNVVRYPTSKYSLINLLYSTFWSIISSIGGKISNIFKSIFK